MHSNGANRAFSCFLGAFLALSLILSVPANANSTDDVEAADKAGPADFNEERFGPGTDLVFELGVGGRIRPQYEGSDDYELTVWPIVGFEYFQIPGLIEPRGVGGDGFVIRPSFAFVRKRNASDVGGFVGLDDVDFTFEIGGLMGYRYKNFRPWADLRIGIGGHNGLVGGVGVDAIFDLMPDLAVTVGPIATFSDSEYADTYFSVPAIGNQPGYDARSGFKSVGFTVRAKYEFADDWFLNGYGEYARLVGDAEDSPIVIAGDRDQFIFGLGISRRFSIDIFRD